MPRVGRIAPGGVIFHVLNRGNGRQRLFHKPQDYDAFLRSLARVCADVPVRVLGVCLMPNHWHLVLWPARDGELSNFMLRLQTAHVRRHFAHRRDEAGGHLYQGRFKSFPVQDDFHLLVLLRYVESNARRARLVRDAGDWQWSSFAMRSTRGGRGGGNGGDAPAVPLHDWPVERPRNWAALLNEALPEPQADAIVTSLRRGRPFGDPEWTARTAKRLGLQFTLNPRGRPRKASGKK